MIIRYIFYLLILVGIYFIVQPVFVNQFEKSKVRLRIDKLFNRKQLKKKNWIYNHIDKMVMFDQDYHPIRSVYSFLFKIVFTFIFSFLLVSITMNQLPTKMQFNNPFVEGITFHYMDFNWKYALLVSLFITSIPYIIKKVQANNRAIQASYDLLEIVKILSQYSNLSLEASLTKTSELLEKNNVLRLKVYYLGELFANFSDYDELRFELERFYQGIKTTFARQFINILLYTEKFGRKNFKSSLFHLYIEMEQQHVSIISIKKETREPIQMGTWGNILVYGICLIGIGSYLGFSTFFKLQFYSETGLTLFITIFLMTCVTFIISAMIGKPKLDY